MTEERNHRHHGVALPLEPRNLGETLETASEPCKFNVKNDGVTIKRKPDGTLYAEAGAGCPLHVSALERTDDNLHVTYSDGTAQDIPVCCDAQPVTPDCPEPVYDPVVLVPEYYYWQTIGMNGTPFTGGASAGARFYGIPTDTNASYSIRLSADNGQTWDEAAMYMMSPTSFMASNNVDYIAFSARAAGALTNLPDGDYLVKISSPDATAPGGEFVAIKPFKLLRSQYCPQAPRAFFFDFTQPVVAGQTIYRIRAGVTGDAGNNWYYDEAATSGTGGNEGAWYASNAYSFITTPMSVWVPPFSFFRGKYTIKAEAYDQHGAVLATVTHQLTVE